VICSYVHWPPLFCRRCRALSSAALRSTDIWAIYLGSGTVPPDTSAESWGKGSVAPLASIFGSNESNGFLLLESAPELKNGDNHFGATFCRG